MLGYIIRRVLQAILITIGVTLIVFILLHLIPGGSVARNILGPRANAEQIAAFNHENGLDEPLPAEGGQVERLELLPAFHPEGVGVFQADAVLAE